MHFDNVLQVREISHYMAPEVTRWQAEALQALQEVNIHNFVVS